MSATYGPIIFPSTGVVQSVFVAQNISSLVVENQSLFDILVSVSASQPQAISQAQANFAINAGIPIVNGGWDLHVGPRQSGVLDIPEQYLIDSPRGGYWTGTVWLEQLIITNSSITGGSFVSNPGNNVWLTGYGPGEIPPVPGANNLGFFLASQTRNVSVPIAVTLNAFGTITCSAAATWTNITTPANLAGFPFTNQAIMAGISSPGQIWTLTYSLSVYMLPLSGVAGTPESQQFQMRFIVVDSSSATVATSNLVYSGFLAHLALQSTAQTIFTPAFPNSLLLTCAAGTGQPYSLIPQIQVLNPLGGGGTNIKPMAVSLWYDTACAVTAGPGVGIRGVTPGTVFTTFVY